MTTRQAAAKRKSEVAQIEAHNLPTVNVKLVRLEDTAQANDQTLENGDNDAVVVEPAVEIDQDKKKRKTYNALHYQNHFWHHSKTAKGGATVYYDCAQQKSVHCKAKLTGKLQHDGTYTYTRNKVEHNHIVDVRDAEVKEIMKKSKASAETGAKNPRSLYAEALAGVSDEVIVQIPKQQAFAKAIREKRKDNGQTAPKSIEDLVLPEILTSLKANFIIYDSGSGKPDRIIMFGTEEALKYMATCPVLSMDGTVSTSPKLFNQLYTIHGVRNGWKTPLVYVACTEKTFVTYRTVLDVLKEKQPTLNPTQVTVDFELAAIKAIKHCLPLAKIQGCIFHFAQSIQRNLQEKHLKQQYETDSKFAFEIRQLVALAYLPIDRVQKTFENFIQNSETLNAVEQSKDANLAYFVNDYFEKNYIGQLLEDKTRKRPKFALNLWNVHDSTLDDLPKTNNIAEGWHNAYERRKKKKFADRDEAIKTAVLTYRQALETQNKEVRDSDDDMADADENGNKPFQLSAESTLLKAIGRMTRL